MYLVMQCDVALTKCGVYYYFVFCQMWSRAYRDDTYHGAVDTNNGAEALNKALKYSYLPRTKNTTLSGIVSLCVEQFIPDMRQMYVFKNYKQSSEYRVYNDKLVPAYLQCRPRNVILHCLERKYRSHKYTADNIKEIKTGTFEICKTGGGKHVVDFGSDNGTAPSCTCKDWQKWQIPCKHFFSVFHSYSEWTWDSLPKEYLNSNYLSQDTDAVETFLSRKLSPDLLPTETAPCIENPVATMPCDSEIPRRTKVCSNHWPLYRGKGYGVLIITRVLPLVCCQLNNAKLCG